MAKYLTATLFLCIPVFLSAQTGKPDPKFVASEEVLIAKPLPNKVAPQEFFIIQEKPVTKDEFNKAWYEREQAKKQKENQQNNSNIEKPHKP